VSDTDTGVKNGFTYTYLERLDYDKFAGVLPTDTDSAVYFFFLNAPVELVVRPLEMLFARLKRFLGGDAIGDVERVAKTLRDGMGFIDHGLMLHSASEKAVIGMIDAANRGRRVPIAGAADHFGILRPMVRPAGGGVVQKHHALALLHQRLKILLQLR
jgi:hypothetical protein